LPARSARRRAAPASGRTFMRPTPEIIACVEDWPRRPPQNAPFCAQMRPFFPGAGAADVIGPATNQEPDARHGRMMQDRAIPRKSSGILAAYGLDQLIATELAGRPLANTAKDCNRTNHNFPALAGMSTSLGPGA
jgi:hypothetical protein